MRLGRRAGRLSLASGTIVALVLIHSITLLAQTRIMPVGNSITEGLQGGTDALGFRNDLKTRLDNAGISFDFVGSTGPAPYEGFFYGGARIEEFYPINHGTGVQDITSTMNTYAPNYILLHIGTNNLGATDVLSPYSYDHGQNFLNTSSGCLAEFCSYLARWKNGTYGTSLKKIILCKIIPKVGVNDRVATLNQEIATITSDSEQNLIPSIPPGTIFLIDQNTPFDVGAMMSSDGIHPNDAGYSKMADVYFNALASLLYTVDNFNRIDLGPSWTADPEYRIINNELSNTSSVNSWGHMAVYNLASSANDVSFQWGATANSLGIDQGGFALMLNSNSVGASGYLLFRRINGNIDFWTIENGNTGHSLGASTIGSQPAPGPGSVMRVLISSDPSGHHFDLFVNGNFDGRVTDVNKEQGNGGNLYAGVMLKGALNNNVDNFYARTTLDVTPPAAVTTLSVSGASSNSISLTWTAPGDDGMSGTASSYLLKYLDQTITEENFASAVTVQNLPLPQSQGSIETFEVHNLIANATYYFGLKTLDEAGNVSALSNVVGATTAGEELMATFIDDFERVELGTNWSTDPEFQIVDGELSNTATNYEWQYMAVLNNRENPEQVQLQWGDNADVAGIGEGGLAVSLNAASPTASGYLIWKHHEAIDLWTIVFGNASESVDNVLGSHPQPSAGDYFTVLLSSDDDGHHFDVYINGEYDGTVTDPDKKQGNSLTQYAGVFLKGALDNDVEEFSVTIPIGDPAKLTRASGDRQYAPAGTRLPAPLVVQVTDENDFPVSGVFVDFEVTSGEAYLSSDSLDYNGYLWAEAEDGFIVSPMRVHGDANASNGHYVGVPEGQGGGVGSVTMTMYLPESGIFYLWLRKIAPSGESDSFFIYADDGQPETWHVPRSTNWAWSQYESSFNFSAGVHTITVQNREDGTLLDKVLLTSDAGYVPGGFGGTTAPILNISNQVGFAQSHLTFGTPTGEVHVRATAEFDGQPLSGSPVSFVEYSTSGEPAPLLYVEGDGQSGPAGQQLPNPFVVRVLDAFDNPVPDVPVEFEIIEGGGTLSNAQPVLTDQTGYASTILTLGTEYFVNVVQASSPIVEGDPIVFTTTASSLIATRIERVSGNYQQGVVGTQLSQPLVVRLLDNIEGPMPNWPVKFRIQGGNGALDGGVDSLTVRTDGSGQAQVLWTLGTQAGEGHNVVTAVSIRADTTLDGCPINFEATATPAPAHRIQMVSGNDQSAPIGWELEHPFKVVITDEFTNPIAGYSVTFQVVEGTGHFSGENQVEVPTDETGIAAIVMTMGGVVGQVNRIEARGVNAFGNPLEDSPIEFQATATEGVASQMIYVSGRDQTTTVGTPLQSPLVVQVKDIFGNPIDQHSVHFEVTAGDALIGDGTELDVLTDAEGRAQVTPSVGTLAGEDLYVIEASSIDLRGHPLQGSPVRFTMSAIPGPAAIIHEISGNDQSAQINTSLNEPFRVQITDQHGNGVADFQVSFEVASGSGTLEGVRQKNVPVNAEGYAQVLFTLGSIAGSNNVVQAVAMQGGQHLDNSPVEFRVTALPGPAAALIQISGSNQTGKAGTVLGQPFVARVTDSQNNSVPDFPVRFTVKAGGGNINGNQFADIPSDSEGLAQVFLTLGENAGVFNNKVTAKGQGLPDSIDFFASTQPDDPDSLTYFSGNNQSAEAGTILPAPFRVRVTDRFNNPINGHTVTFTVVEGNGNIDGVGLRNVSTNDQGIAQVFLTLGTTPEINTVEATSEHDETALKGSPVTFNATANLAAPSEVAYFAGDDQDGVVGNPLPIPLQVLVSDVYENPYPYYEVTFTVIEGGGGLGPNQVTSLVDTTDTDGIASATFTLGPQPGTDNNKVQASASYLGTPLNGSPVEFKASGRTTAARALVDASGDDQTGTVGQPLPNPFRVRAVDAQDAPVQGHPVTFEVVAGNGTLDDNGSMVVKMTNALGIAEATLTLGHAAGDANNTVRASATSDGVNPLQNSPVLFTASANADVPDTSRSTVTATGPVRADGVSQSNILIVLKDTFDNPVPGKNITVTASGSDNTITQPLGPSDANGRVTASLASTRAETKTISARDITDDILLTDVTEVEFTALPASMIAIHPGEDQTGPVGTALPSPFAVDVTDPNGNPVPGHPVEFLVISGGGQILETQPVLSDSDGVAACDYILGQSPGVNVVEAHATGLNGSPVEFRAVGVISQAAVISKAAGDDQTASVGSTLPDPLTVDVTDDQGRSVWGIAVTFSPISPPGGEILDRQPVSTNAFGQASVHYRLAPQVGRNIINVTAENVQGMVQFTANGMAGNASQMLIQPYDAQGTVGQILGSPLAVQITDDHGNPVPNHPVEFSVNTGEGYLLGTQPVTSDTLGIASTLAVLSTQAGLNVFKALSVGLPEPVYFQIQGTAGPAASIQGHSGDAQTGTPGMPLLSPLEVVVQDQFGNMVPHTPVNFIAASGGGSFIEEQPVFTNESGIASSHWVLGDVVGTQTAWALKSGVGGSPVGFTAEAVNNGFPDILLPVDTLFYENDQIVLQIHVSDPDGDQVTVTAEGIPTGASFNSTTGILTWQPSYDQAGSYEIIFTAIDNKGAITTETLCLHILNKNRAPEITAVWPGESTFTLKHGESKTFTVEAIDLDGDSLYYVWKRDNITVGRDTSYFLVATLLFPGSYQVVAHVFDHEDTTSHSWTVDIITAVELLSFTAEAVPYQGVRVNWKTGFEFGNAGFKILRSASREGNYEELNSQLVPSREDRTYFYQDHTCKAGRTYFYKLADVDVNGRITEHQPVAVEIPVPKRYYLYQNYPNPFNPLTTIRYELPKTVAVELKVYDIMGRVVRTLIDETQEPGYHSTTWDGRNEVGEMAGSGVYYLRLIAGNHRSVKKMALIR